MKSKKESKKTVSIVSRTSHSLAVLERREKNNQARINSLQKRIDKAAKLDEEMKKLNAKQKEITDAKAQLLSEIRSIVAAFSEKPTVETSPVS